MTRRLGVAVRAVVRRDSRILMVRRSSACGHDPDLWELPGGKIDPDEILTEALQREVAEETGIGIEVGRPFTTWHFVKEPFWVTGITFECRYVRGELRLSGEHSEGGWFTVKEALDLPLALSEREQLEAYRLLTPSKGSA